MKAQQKTEPLDVASRLLRAVRKAERTAGDGAEVGGTGFTIIKRQDSPIIRLLDRSRIGQAELRAGEDIVLTFQAMAGALMLKPLSLERRDPSAHSTEPVAILDATARYKSWARAWSDRAKQSDPTLEIVVAAIVDERPFREIDYDLSLRNGRAADATVAGLRDYAARGGWGERNWRVEGSGVFRLRKPRPVITLLGLARRWDREAAA